MSEEEAQAWLLATFGAAPMTSLQRYVALLLEEVPRQNLISPATVATVWCRHIVDSAQLVPLGQETSLWVDVGSGAGLPGLVVALLRPAPMLLVEPRRQRAEFLERCVAELGLGNVAVRQAKIERVEAKAAVISARAVAPLEKLLQAAAGCGTSATWWLLPRGRSGAAELAALEQRWAGVFHMKQSLTDAEATILQLEGPRRR